MLNLRCGEAVGLLLVFGLPVLATTSWAQQHNPILEKLAKTYGLDSWDPVEAVRYPWNGEITGLFQASQAWTWESKTNQIIFEGKDKEGKPVKVPYDANELRSQPDNIKNEVQPSFVNDNYWFLLPFHAYWVSYKKAGPLLVLTEQRGTADGAPLHIFFTNVAVKLVGSDKWMPEQ